MTSRGGLHSYRRLRRLEAIIGSWIGFQKGGKLGIFAE